MPHSKGWLGKFITAFSRPKVGQVFVNKSSENLNVFFGRKGLFGKILFWSPRNKARWITSKWFKRHNRVFWPNKEIVRIDVDNEKISNMEYRKRVGYLKKKDVEERLTEEIDKIEQEKHRLYLRYPIDFYAFCVLLIFLPFLLLLLFGSPLLW